MFLFQREVDSLFSDLAGSKTMPTTPTRRRNEQNLSSIVAPMRRAAMKSLSKTRRIVETEKSPQKK